MERSHISSGKEQAPRTRAPITVPVLMGPTAAGKTALAIGIAVRLGNLEIISADSRQVYTGMDIGTAKPTLEERAGVPHHLIDIITPDTIFSAGEFASRAAALIDAIRGRGNVPFIVGGSGFYVRALFEGLAAPTMDQGMMERLMERGRHEGFDLLHRELAAIDPLAAAAHSPNNHVKTVRALACYYQTGRSYSSYLAESEAEHPSHYVPAYLGILPPRAELYDRINRRALLMLQHGFLDEVRTLVNAGYTATSPGLRTVGYTEALQHLAGELGYDRMIELMQQGTRRFAKRQMTWYRGMQDVTWMEIGEVEAGAEWMRREIGNKK